MADPEPISDISAQNTNVGSPNAAENDANQIASQTVATPEAPVVLKTYPKHLQPLLGKLGTDQQIHKEKKIVLYVLSAQNGEESLVLANLIVKLITSLFVIRFLHQLLTSGGLQKPPPLLRQSGL